MNEYMDILKQIIRRLDTQERTVDLIYKDRNILEDILVRLTALEAALHKQRDTITETAKEARANIGEVKSAVENKVNEMNDTIDGKTIIVKSPRESVFQKIVKKLKGR